jgi:nucleotide-binding universal stress UspA family protein
MFDVDGEICELPLCVDRIIRGEPRPVLLVPEAESGQQHDASQAPVLVAFDGSPASSRTVHMFALLGLGAGRVAHVVTLDRSSASRAEETARRACALLRRHGAAETRAIGLGDREAGTPAETILGLAKALKPGMIVMGAYGTRGIQEIFGSCTREVLNACPTPLFLHH